VVTGRVEDWETLWVVNAYGKNEGSVHEAGRSMSSTKTMALGRFIIIHAAPVAAIGIVVLPRDLYSCPVGDDADGLELVGEHVEDAVAFSAYHESEHPASVIRFAF
jgi:hypothetical protein